MKHVWSNFVDNICTSRKQKQKSAVQWRIYLIEKYRILFGFQNTNKKTKTSSLGVGCLIDVFVCFFFQSGGLFFVVKQADAAKTIRNNWNFNMNFVVWIYSFSMRTCDTIDQSNILWKKKMKCRFSCCIALLHHADLNFNFTFSFTY